MNKAVFSFILKAFAGCQTVGANYEPPQATLPDSWGANQNSEILPTESDQVWLAGEQQVTAYLKNHFIDERMIPKTSLFAKGYWQKGNLTLKAMFKAHTWR